MSIQVAGKTFVTLEDKFYVNGSQVLEAWANGVKVYPEGIGAHIEITVLPSRLNYIDGELISLDGITVVAYDEDGSTYRGYPDGAIPVDKLFLTNGTATFDGGSSGVNYTQPSNHPWYTRNYTLPIAPLSSRVYFDEYRRSEFIRPLWEGGGWYPGYFEVTNGALLLEVPNGVYSYGLSPYELLWVCSRSDGDVVVHRTNGTYSGYEILRVSGRKFYYSHLTSNDIKISNPNPIL